jgi:hypothetical protein
MAANAWARWRRAVASGREREFVSRGIKALFADKSLDAGSGKKIAVKP